MQHSKSLGSFASEAVLPVEARPRARSSLDTFVIPGRTRIPSGRPEPLAIDLQVAETLLNSNIMQAVNGMSGPKQNDAEERQGLLDNLSEETTVSDTQNDPSESLFALQQPLHKVRPEILKRPPPRIGAQETIVIPPRRPRKIGQGSTPPKRQAPSPPQKQQLQKQQCRGIYDGAIGSSYESRQKSQVSMTMSWSTGSHVSRRILSNSSSSSQGPGAFESLGEYNRLATRHRLPELEKCPGRKFKVLKRTWNGPANASLEENLQKSVEKTHQHNWLARKLFHRSSSTYTLKLKNTPKPVKRKKSFGVIPKLEDGGQKNILKDRSVEEICRLGGVGLLILPKEFAVENLTLPTCLSATGTFLLQHGKAARFQNSYQLLTIMQDPTPQACSEYQVNQVL